jgi:hypothetical protein
MAFNLALFSKYDLLFILFNQLGLLGRAFVFD